MSNTFSSVQHDVGGGRIYSSRSGLVKVLPPPGRPPGVPLTGAGQAAAPFAPFAGGAAGFQFALSGQGLPTAALTGGQPTGTVAVTLGAGGTAAVSGTVESVPALADPALHMVLWLLYDLPVPHDLSPADQALLARGPAGGGNAPGQIFTFDGKPPTYGVNSMAIAVSPGEFRRTDERKWQLTGAINPMTNRAFHPLTMIGPTALADINASMATGTVAHLLTDLYLRQATVHPELDLRAKLPQRLFTLVSEAAGRPDRFLEPELFARAAVTLEGPVRPTPYLMPTRQACLLAAQSRVTE